LESLVDEAKTLGGLDTILGVNFFEGEIEAPANQKLVIDFYQDTLIFSKIDEFETKDEQTSDEKKKQICTETKEKIHKIWLMTVEEHIPDEDIKANYKSQEFFTETYCELPLWNYSPKAHEMIEEEFETKEAFVEICMRLRDIGDCSKYQPDNKGAWYFIKKTFMFVDFLSDGGTCIYNLIKGGGEITNHKANEKVKSLADTVLGTWEITKFLGKEIGAFFAHITSFGIWGFLKAAWHIINLTMNIIKSTFYAYFRFNFIIKLCEN
jgi:hypothetical protein